MNLNVKLKTIEHIEENTGEYLCDPELDKVVSDIIPKTWLIKEKIYKLNLIKLIKKSAFQRTQLRRWQDKSKTGRKYLQNTYCKKKKQQPPGIQK